MDPKHELAAAYYNLTATQERCTDLIGENRVLREMLLSMQRENAELTTRWLSAIVPPKVRCRRVRPNAIVPRYQTDGASGLDLHACLDAPLRVWAGDTVTIPTGVAIELPAGFEAQVRPRSGLAAKRAMWAILGTIDADYRGEIGVILHCGFAPGKPVYVEPGDRIAQLVVAPVARVSMVEVEELSETARGAGGFGSTGVCESATGAARRLQDRDGSTG